MGQSIAVNLGTQNMILSSFEQWLHYLEHDQATEVIVLIGQSYGNKEELAAKYISAGISKPVIAYIAGHKLPTGNEIKQRNMRMVACQPLGLVHNASTVKQKISALLEAHIPVAESIREIPDLVKQALLQKKSWSHSV